VTSASLVEGDGGFMAGLGSVSAAVRGIFSSDSTGAKAEKEVEKLVNLKDDALAKRFGDSFFTKQNKKRGNATYKYVKYLQAVMDLRF
jgi:hypothetical protein